MSIVMANLYTLNKFVFKNRNPSVQFLFKRIWYIILFVTLLASFLNLSIAKIF